jgi:hypothetical protein
VQRSQANARKKILFARLSRSVVDVMLEVRDSHYYLIGDVYENLKLIFLGEGAQLGSDLVKDAVSECFLFLVGHG